MNRTNVDFLANELVRKAVYFLILRQSLLFPRGLKAGSAEIAGSNPDGGLDVCRLLVLFVVW
jgi:hypothetical protein